jgi:hypothetical protein
MIKCRKRTRMHNEAAKELRIEVIDREPCGISTGGT